MNMKVFHVEWGLSDYDPPAFGAYIEAKSEEAAINYAIEKLYANESDIMATEIEIIKTDKQ